MAATPSGATPARHEREEPLRNLVDFLAANERYASTQHRSSDAVAPRRHAAVLLCMDARLHPSDFMGVAAGDVHMLRNGGGRVTTDVIQSLVASQQILGSREICAFRYFRCALRMLLPCVCCCLASRADASRCCLAAVRRETPWPAEGAFSSNMDVRRGPIHQHWFKARPSSCVLATSRPCR